MDGVMNDVVNYCNAASWKDCLICLLLQFLLKPHHQCGYPLVNIQKTTEKSPCLLGKSTIFMIIFNSYVSLPEGS